LIMGTTITCRIRRLDTWVSPYKHPFNNLPPKVEFEMKKIFVLLFVIGMASCQDLEEMNINPNLPTETHPQLLLTKVEWDVFREYRGTGPLYALKMLVQTDGENANQYYKWDRGSFGPYAVMRDISKMM